MTVRHPVIRVALSAGLYAFSLWGTVAVAAMLVPTYAYAASQSLGICSSSQSRSTDYGTYMEFNDYEGVAAGKAIGMTLIFHGTMVDGQVFVAPEFHDIAVKGEVNTRGELTLTAAGSDKSESGVFHGQFKDLYYCDSFKGSWDRPLEGIPAEAWSLTLSHINSGDEGKNYYSDLGIRDDRQIDDNALALQKAILAKDKVAVSKMVVYPLQVMFGRKRVDIKDAQQFLLLYDQIFLPYMLEEIAATIPHHMFDKDDGALFTSMIWLDTTGKLRSIDVLGRPIACEFPPKSSQGAPSAATTEDAQKFAALCKKFAGSMPAEDPNTYETDYVCDTPKHHIVIDSKADEVPRYRAWIKPRPMEDKPDMEIDSGSVTVEGTGVCASSIWTFKRGDTQFEISPLGCSDGSEPHGAVGQVLITIKGDLKQTLWCMRPTTE